MNEWASVSFDDFLVHLHEIQQGALALAAREPPPFIDIRDEPLEASVARTNCVLRATRYVQQHREALWGAGLLHDRDHYLAVQNRLWRALHAYFTDPAQPTDAPEPPTAEIIRSALSDPK